MEQATKLLETRVWAGDLLTIRLEKPAGYRFEAGQYCILTPPDRGFQDERGLRRPLSIAAAPTEPDLLFATRKSESAFKKTLAALTPGTPVRVEEARGALRLPVGTDQPLVFLAGGIGITPFRSLLRYAADFATGHRITLFYSNRTPEETLFLADLLSLAASHANLRVVATMTRMGESSMPWNGLTGRLTASIVREQCPEWQQADYFLAGPPSMVETLEGTLRELGIEAPRIHVERFSGS